MALLLSLGVKRSILETDGTNENFKQSKRSKQDEEELRKAIKKKLRHLPRKVSLFSNFHRPVVIALNLLLLRA